MNNNICVKTKNENCHNYKITNNIIIDSDKNKNGLNILTDKSLNNNLEANKISENNNIIINNNINRNSNENDNDKINLEFSNRQTNIFISEFLRNNLIGQSKIYNTPECLNENFCYNIKSFNDIKYTPMIGLEEIEKAFYMNAIIQCFSNTYYLIEYFLNDNNTVLLKGIT